MADATFTVDKRFRDLLAKTRPGALDRAQREAATDFSIMLEGELKKRTLRAVQRKTRFLAKSWFARPDSRGLVINAGNTAPYAAHVEFGTRAHDIPKRGIPGRGRKVLAWRSGGRGPASSFKGGKTTGPDVFVSGRKVRHPGTKGRFIWRDTLKVMIPRGLKVFSDALERALRA